jgi:hypothetical protein
MSAHIRHGGLSLTGGARTRPGPWPSPGIIIVDPDTYFGSALLLERGQNIFLPCVGSEQYASPCTPQTFSFSPPTFPPPDSLARDNLSRGEGAASEWRATDLRPNV